jgi:hypothetical protein
MAELENEKPITWQRFLVTCPPLKKNRNSEKMQKNGEILAK